MKPTAILFILILLFLTSCGRTPFKDESIIVKDGVEYKLKVESTVHLGFYWEYQYYEKVTYADGREEWVPTKRSWE